MDNICVIGGLGFVCSNVSAALADIDYSVTIVDDCSFGTELNMPENCKLIKKDFSELGIDFYNQFPTVVMGYCSNIIYAINEPIKTFENNALKFAEFCTTYKGKIVYLSTSSVYNNAIEIPTKEDSEIHCYNAYDTSKRIAELVLQLRGNYTTLRLSNVFGKNQRSSNPYCGVVSRFIDSVLNEDAMELIGNGEQSRDFTHISDVVRAVKYAVEMPSQNTEYNIGTGVETTIKKLAETISQVINKPTSIKYIEERKIDKISRRCLDVSKARDLNGWRPEMSLKDGLHHTVKWMINSENL